MIIIRVRRALIILSHQETAAHLPTRLRVQVEVHPDLPVAAHLLTRLRVQVEAHPDLPVAVPQAEEADVAAHHPQVVVPLRAEAALHQAVVIVVNQHLQLLYKLNYNR